MRALLLADTTAAAGGPATVAYLVVLVLLVASVWAILVKAGQPGWAAIIPIYNLYVLTKVVGRPGWWVILYLIPIVNIVVLIILYNDLSRSFGKGVGYTFGIIFLPIVFLPMLGFGSARYEGPAAA